MSELKSVYIDRTGDWARSGTDTGKFYLKSEVDEVIAELKRDVDTWTDSYEISRKINAELEAKNRKLKRALYKACANWAMAESYSVLNDVPTANRWIRTLRKLKTNLEGIKI